MGEDSGADESGAEVDQQALVARTGRQPKAVLLACVPPSLSSDPAADGAQNRSSPSSRASCTTSPPSSSKSSWRSSRTHRSRRRGRDRGASRGGTRSVSVCWCQRCWMRSLEGSCGLVSPRARGRRSEADARSVSNSMLATRLRTQLNCLIFDKTLKVRSLLASQEPELTTLSHSGKTSPESQRLRSLLPTQGGPRRRRPRSLSRPACSTLASPTRTLGARARFSTSSPSTSTGSFPSRACGRVELILLRRVADFSVWCFSIIDAPAEIIIGTCASATPPLQARRES